MLRLARKIKPRFLLRQAIARLPKGVRHEIFRKLVRLPGTLPDNLEFKIATEKDELEAAFRILHDEYVRKGYMREHPSGMRLTAYHALPSTSTLIALWDGEVAGTVSVVRSSPFGFPLDAIFDSSELKKFGARVAEISALAIAKEYRENSGLVFFPLLKFLYEYCIKFFGVDYMIIAVTPEHFDFYQGLLFFEEFENSRIPYDFVNGTIATGGYLEMRMAYRKFASFYGRNPNRTNLFRFFMELEIEKNFNFPDREYFKISDPVMSPEMLRYFFREKSNIFDSMSEKEAHALNAQYIGQDYRQVLPTTDLQDNFYALLREHPRFEVSCDARIIGDRRVVDAKIIDVSSCGIRAHLGGNIRFGAITRINIAIAAFEIADLEGWPVWRNESGVYGFKLETVSKNWQEFIEHLVEDMRLGISNTA